MYFFFSCKQYLWVSKPGMVWWFHGHQETRPLLSCSSAIFDTCFHFIVQDDCSCSLYRMCIPASKKGEGKKKSLSSLSQEITCDILLMFLCSQWSHLFEEEGEKCNLYSAQLHIQLKMEGGGSGPILWKETRSL